MLHGFMGCGAQFSFAIDELEVFYKVLIIDLPGHGLSVVNSERSYTIRDYAVMVDETIRNLDLELHPICFLGYSFSALIATHVALNNTLPTPIRSVLLVCPVGVSVKGCNHLMRSIMKKETPGRLASHLFVRTILPRAYRISSACDEGKDLLKSLTDFNIENHNNLTITCQRMLRLEEMSDFRDSYRKLSEMNVDFSVVIGEYDDVINLDNTYTFFQEIGVSTVVVPFDHHFIFSEYFPSVVITQLNSKNHGI
ncbi:hypothetical protein PCE1_001001 [Barthelona sp. PCE]